jgi:hypothetical protein
MLELVKDTIHPSRYHSVKKRMFLACRILFPDHRCVPAFNNEDDRYPQVAEHLAGELPTAYRWWYLLQELSSSIFFERSGLSNNISVYWGNIPDFV